MNQLTFDKLDDLAFSISEGRGGESADELIDGDSLGPVLEWGQTRKNWDASIRQQVPRVRLNRLQALWDALKRDSPVWSLPGNSEMGFLRLAENITTRENDWVAFGVAAQKAAANAGFTGATSGQLVAALGEFRSNIVEHSMAPDSCLLAYAASVGRFEFVALDSGIGLLESLKGCSEYAALSDHGSALELALTQGVSRFGSDADRGYGFRPLFVGLANLNCSLRFRTGDHALEIDGQSPSLIGAHIVPKVAIPGFFIAVDCSLT